MARINPLDVLSKGTAVSVGSKRGVVIGCEVVPAHPCGMIAVHTIHLKEKRKNLYGNVFKYVSCDEIWSGNYSFVNAL